MEINTYISSGILELYVYGALTEQESIEVSKVLKQYPEIEAEVLEIENALVKLSEGVAPSNPELLINRIKEKIASRNKVVPITKSKEKTNWPAYIGWAASLLFLIGLFFMFNKNQQLRENLVASQAENAQMESQIAASRENEEKAQELLTVLRSRDILRVPLQGQEVAPQAYATVYWDRNRDVTYIDAKDLPEPPRGMVYQVWSLKLQPLTPTSLGLLEDFVQNENKIFSLENLNPSEGFGITLEPEGGSETPTMEQLYTLGTVST